MHRDIHYRRHALALGIAFLLIWTALAVAPQDRHDWAMENALVLALVVAMAAGCRYFVFSRTAFTLIFLFLCIHELGAHFTYSRVPYDRWLQALTGYSLDAAMGWRRNQFDRLVHLAYGLLMVYPIRQLSMRLMPLRGFWSYFVALNIILSTSALYELIEWVGGEYLGGDEAAAYVGAQGSEWDAQKDMALAAFGALLALLAEGCLNRWRQRDRSRMWANGEGARESPRAALHGQAY
jgi:putative membrane protein